MATPKRLILIDGSNLVFRAFYAIPGSFRTAAGMPTNAVYGFATMFRKMLAGRTPDMGAMVFDAPGPTFRQQEYSEYKAQRPEMPDELRPQLAWIDRLVEEHRFPMLRLAGFEADDIIGTLARRAQAAAAEVFIVSSDKDFAQLIGEGVRMVDTLQDVTYDPELVRKKWGVPPERFVDFLALTGDKIDNIPGVVGIGKKGASTLLERFGDLEGIYANLEELKGRQKSALGDQREMAFLSRRLATIDCEVPLEIELDDLRLDLPEPSVLNELYKELEFYSLLTDDALAATGREVSFDVCGDIDAVEELVESLQGHREVALIPVFDAPSPVLSDLTGLCFSTGDGVAAWVPVGGLFGLGRPGLEALRAWLESETSAKITHNCKALWICLARFGVELRGVVGDVMLESFLVEPTQIIPHRLGQIAKQYLRRTVRPAKAVLGGGKSARRFLDLETEEVAGWAAERVAVVAEAWPAVRSKLEDEGHLKTLFELEFPLARVLGSMELAGIAVDPDDLREMEREFGDRLRELEAGIFSSAGREFNIGSPKQLSDVLFDELELPVIKRTKSGYSTNAEVLERLVPHHEIASLVLEYRKLAKLINTYTEVLRRAVNPSTGRIHTTFQQTVGATGRLITTDPDLQRTPVKTPEGKRIRQTFVAGEGHRLISADWSQIELRLLAHFTADELLVAAFVEGRDIHCQTAGELFEIPADQVSREQRAVGKLVNFSTIYGQGATALGQILGVPRKQAKAYIEGYFESYRGVREWLDETITRAHESGYVTTLFGRRRYIPELSSNSFMQRQAGERMAANTPIQGSAADLCKLAMVRIAGQLESRKLETRMLLQVHDELVFEAPEKEVEEVCAVVRREMEEVFPLETPLVADVGVGRNWAEAH